MARILFFSHYSTHAGLDGANRMLMVTAAGLPNEKYKKVFVSPHPGVISEHLKNLKITEKIIPYDCNQLSQSIFRAFNKNKDMDPYKKIEKALSKHPLYHFFHAWKPDIVYANTILSIPAAILGKMVGAKVLLHVHEIVSNNLKKEDRAIFFNLVNRYADKIIVISRAVMKSMGKPGRSKRCELVYNGVEFHGYKKAEIRRKGKEIRKRLRLEEERPVAAYLGSIAPHKGVDMFIRMADLILKKDPSFRFLIIGDVKREPSYTRALKRLVRILGRDEEIKFTGYCHQLSDLLPAIDCLVVPSAFKEPFGLVHVEANLFFKPVVAFDTGGIAEAVIHGKNGLLVQSGDIESLAFSVYAVCKGLGLKEKMGNYGYRRAVTRFGLPRYVKNMNEILEELLAGSYNPSQRRDGRIIKGRGPEVYIIQDGRKRHIKDEKVLERLGIDWSDVETVSDEILHSIPTGESVK